MAGMAIDLQSWHVVQAVLTWPGRMAGSCAGGCAQRVCKGFTTMKCPAVPSFETFLQVRFDPGSVFGLSLEMLPLPRLPGDSSLCTAKQ